MEEDYDIGEYELWLQDPGGRHAVVMQTLRRLQPDLDLQAVRDLVQSAPGWLGDYTSYEEVMTARRALESVGATVTVIPQRYLFPPGLLGEDPEDEYDATDVHYSRHLRALREPALTEWAQAADVYEAYRFLYFPSFDPVVIVRIWQTTAGNWKCEAVRGTGRGGYAPGPPDRQAVWEPLRREVELLLTTVEETSYWNSSWPRMHFSPEGQRMGILDGALWVFEGWKAGRYQGQFAHSPGDDPRFAAQRRLGELFFELIGDRLGSLRIY